MGATNSAALAAANTIFTTAAAEVFSGRSESIHSKFVDVYPASGTSVEVVVADGAPRLRKWVGAKQFNDIRFYGRNYPVEQWESSFELPGTLVRGDNTGLVAKRIAEHAADAADSLDYIMIDALIANTLLGYDGVTLLNDSHPHAHSTGTADNLTTDALGFSIYNTARQGLHSMADEFGRNLGLVPTMLLVGTDQERIGMEVTGSTRPFGMNNTGAEATSGVVAGITMPHYTGGSMDLIVTPKITGNQWFMMALNRPSVRPLGLAMFRNAVHVPEDQDGDFARYNRDVFQYSLEADATPHPLAWQCIYGSVTA